MTASQKLAQQATKALEVVAEQLPTRTEQFSEHQGMMQVRSQYSTAVQVVRPRVLKLVETRCLDEAAIAGESFYYSWKQGGQIIEGPSIGAAMAIVRNFGNCAVDCTVQETADSYIFQGAFIDLETGFNLSRPFRQSKEGPRRKDGTAVYADERGRDVVFQIGASKAIRNAVLNAVPKWLVEKVMDRAKENVTKIISEMGPEKARAMIVQKAAALGIETPRLEVAYGRQKTWDMKDLVMLSSALRAIEDGFESADKLFPFKAIEEAADATVVGEKKEETKPDSGVDTEASKNEEAVFVDAIKEAKSQDDLRKILSLIDGKLADKKISQDQRNMLVGFMGNREEEILHHLKNKAEMEKRDKAAKGGKGEQGELLNGGGSKARHTRTT